MKCIHRSISNVASVKSAERVLRADTINPLVQNAEYAVRGEVAIRAESLRQVPDFHTRIPMVFLIRYWMGWAMNRIWQWGKSCRSTRLFIAISGIPNNSTSRPSLTFVKYTPFLDKDR